MKLLIVGAAGYVGKIVCPALDKEHDCTYFDLQPVRGAENRTIIADVNDDVALKRAVRDYEGVLYMPIGQKNTGIKFANRADPALIDSVNHIDPAFDVNIKGLYRFISFSLHSGVSWFCYVSSMSVYDCIHNPHHTTINERVGSDSWGPYGMSKRVGEFLCESMSRVFPNAIVLVLRLYLPKSDEDWGKTNESNDRKLDCYPTGPESTRELFLAASRCKKPGCHILNLTGDVDNKHFDLSLSKELLGWEPHDG